METKEVEVLKPVNKNEFRAFIQKAQKTDIIEEGDIKIHDATFIHQLLSSKDVEGKNIIVYIDERDIKIERPLYKNSYEQCLEATLEKAPIPKEKNIKRDLRLIALRKTNTIEDAAKLLGIKRTALSGWIHKDDPDKNIELED